MKRNLLASLLLLALAIPAVARADHVVIVHDGDNGGGTTPFAHSGAFGIGVGGTSLVSGLTGKVYFSSATALQATVGYWYRQGPEINLDLIFEMPKLASNRTVSLNWNLGFGGTLGFGHRSDNGYSPVGGIDGVLGLGLQVRPVPLEFVIELRPTYIIGSDGAWDGLYFGAGASIRVFLW